MSSMADKSSPTQGKRGPLEVSVLQSRCIGAAVCVYEAKGSFKLNKANKAEVTDLSASSENAVINAAKNCPVQAIYVYKNKKQIWPEPGPDTASKQPGPESKMNFD